ncbi:MAG: STAS domain-containing protein [Gammaproteobacteria bacterium]|nr:STAS domain-containing protein [Gammaproteobacteria bacterium]
MSDFSVDINPAGIMAGSRNVMVVTPRGSINPGTTPTLERHVDELIAKHYHTLIMDLTATDFISSSGIGFLLSTANLLREKSGDLILMNPPKLIDDIMANMNIKNYFRTIRRLDDIKHILVP